MKINHYLGMYLIIGMIFIIGLPDKLIAKDSFWDTTLEKAKNLIDSEKKGIVEEVVDKTKDVKDGVKDLSEDYVIKSIKKYNKIISDMKSDVNSKTWYLFDKDDQEKFDVILDGVKDIVDFYSDLRENKIEVKNKMLSYIEDIRRFNKSLDPLVPKEEKEKEFLKNELIRIENNSNYSTEEKTIKIKSIEKRITFTERRIKLLNDFKNNYQKLLPVMHNTKKSIDKFIFVIEESASVYAAAYRTLKLQKDISNAYRTIEELQSLDYLSEDIMKSWTELESIIKVLTEQITDTDDPNTI